MSQPVPSAGHSGSTVPVVVYVRLLDEGTDVWRPTTAREVGSATYELLPTSDYVPSDETWEFQPGTTVRCEWRDLSGGRCLAALRWVAGPPQRSDAHLKVIDKQAAKAFRRSEAIAAWVFGAVLVGIAVLNGVAAFTSTSTSTRGVVWCAAGTVALVIGALMQRFHLLSLMGVLLMATGAGCLVGGGVALITRAF